MTTVRHITREKAFQTLYLMNLRNELSREEALQQTFSLSVEKQDLTAEESLKEILEEEKLSKNDKVVADALSYLGTLVGGVAEHNKNLDEQISSHLTKWSIQRIEKVNLIILRLAAYELLFEAEIDPSIVINEAVELAKTFNDDKSSKFVNGILQAVLDNKAE